MFAMAYAAYVGSLDESAWYPIVRGVLQFPDHNSSSKVSVKAEDPLHAYTRGSITQTRSKKATNCGGKSSFAIQSRPPKYLQRVSATFSSKSRIVPFRLQRSCCRKDIYLRLIEMKALSGDIYEESYLIALALAATLEKLYVLEQDDHMCEPVLS